MSTNCGRSIKVAWNSLDSPDKQESQLLFEYEMKLVSSSDKSSQLFTTRFYYVLHGLTINTFYELWLRAIKKEGRAVGLWAKTMIRTSAGIDIA